MDVASELADFAIGLDFNDLHSEVIDSAKKMIMDTLAVMIIGSSASGVAELVEIVKD